MFKRIFTLFLAISLLSVFPISAFATENEDRVVPAELSLIEDATVAVSPLSNDRFEISLSSVESIAVFTNKDANDSAYRQSSLTFIAESTNEKEEILSRINQVQRGGGTNYDDKDFFGNSCYIYVSVTFTTRSSSLGPEARMTSVSTKYQVRDGTSIKNATLRLSCMGTSSDAGSVYKQHEIPVRTASYTTTYPASWPYIYDGSALLGAAFEVTAKRPSGESRMDTVSVTIYKN